MNTSTIIEDDQGIDDASTALTQAPSAPPDPATTSSRDLFAAARAQRGPDADGLNADTDDAGDAASGVNPDGSQQSPSETGTAQQSSRRSRAAARTDEDFEAEVERRAQARLAELQPKAPEAEPVPDEEEAWFQQERGDDAEWLELSGRNDRGMLDYEALRRFNRMNALRDGEKQITRLVDKRADARFQESKNGLFASLATQALEVSALPGVDAEYIQAHPGYGDICRHFYEAGKRIAERDHERTRGELKEANARAANAAPRPLYGGRSVAADAQDAPDPKTSSSRELFGAAGRQRDQAGRRR